MLGEHKILSINKRDKVHVERETSDVNRETSEISVLYKEKRSIKDEVPKSDDGSTDWSAVLRAIQKRCIGIPYLFAPRASPPGACADYPCGVIQICHESGRGYRCEDEESGRLVNQDQITFLFATFFVHVVYFNKL